MTFIFACYRKMLGALLLGIFQLWLNTILIYSSVLRYFYMVPLICFALKVFKNMVAFALFFKVRGLSDYNSSNIPFTTERVHLK